MSEWLNEVFSGGVSLKRVNPAGAVLLLLSVAMLVAEKPISRRCGENEYIVCCCIRFAALIICALGGAVSIL